MQFDTIGEDTDECLICFENNIVDGDTVIEIMEIDEIPNLVKPCACRFQSHQLCITAWLAIKPACPFCGTSQYFEIEDLVFPTNLVQVKTKWCNEERRVRGLLFYACGFFLIVIFFIIISS